MTDEKPASPSVRRQAVGPRPRPPAGRATNAGPARPGGTPVNSPAAIPAIMRGPAAVATTSTDRSEPGSASKPDDQVPPAPGGGRVHSPQSAAAVRRPVTPGLSFRPIVQVADVAAAIVFYEHLGAEVIHGGPDTDYVLMQLGTVQIGLVARPADAEKGAGRDAYVQLDFSAALPLHDLERHLRERGVTIARSVHNTGFGPQLHVRAPDGLLIRIGQLETDESP